MGRPAAGRRWLINSPVLTAYGEYRLEGPLDMAQARLFDAGGAASAIGHAAAARLLSLLLGREIRQARVAVSMRPGDRALVLRVKCRLPEGRVLDAQALAQVPHELALLTRLR